MGTDREENTVIEGAITREQIALTQPQSGEHSSSLKFFGPVSLSFSEARDLQEQMIEDRINARGKDSVIFCEHPRTISCGKRSNKKDLLLSEAEFKELAIEIVNCSRGGEVTAHMPGQLVIYPVVSLRERGIGVRRFVESGLRAICAAVVESGIKAWPDLACPGVWVLHDGEKKKIAAVGLSVHQGVTNHGFSVNIDCDLSLYSHIVPCGLSATSVISLKALGVEVSLNEIACRLKNTLINELAGE